MKNIQISLETDWLMNHLIISAMRYDASRSSYIVSDLIDIAGIIHKNRDKFDEDRVKWLVRDLRETASNRLGYLKNVQCNNNYNDRIVYDAYTLIAKHLQDNPDIRFCDYDWEVDCISGKINTYKRNEPLYKFGDGNYVQPLYDCDISTIVTAANIIDKSCHCIVVSEYQGKTSEDLCFPSVCHGYVFNQDGKPAEDYTYNIQYKLVDSPHTWVVKKFITSIKSTNNDV